MLTPTLIIIIISLDCFLLLRSMAGLLMGRIVLCFVCSVVVVRMMMIVVVGRWIISHLLATLYCLDLDLFCLLLLCYYSFCYSHPYHCYSPTIPSHSNHHHSSPFQLCYYPWISVISPPPTLTSSTPIHTSAQTPSQLTSSLFPLQTLTYIVAVVSDNWGLRLRIFYVVIRYTITLMTIIQLSDDFI